MAGEIACADLGDKGAGAPAGWGRLREGAESYALMTVILEAEPHRTYTKTEVRCN